MSVSPIGKFIGFVIHQPCSGEFLIDYSDDNIFVSMLWGSSPSVAKIFDKNSAKRALKSIDKPEAQICHLYDRGNQYMVAYRE